MTTNNSVELDLVWLIVAALLGAYVFVFGFLKKLNEWYYVIRLGKKHSSLPPGDMGWPFIGNTISLFKAFRSQDRDLSFINNIIHRYGKSGIYKTNLYGNPSIIVCSPELCRKILTDDEQFISGYPPSLIKLVGENTFTVPHSNTEHKRMRKLLTAPINGHEALSIYVGYIEKIVISSLDKWVHNNSPIEMVTEMKKFSFNVIYKIFMGSTDSSSESVSKYYTVMFNGLFVLLPFSIPGLTFHQAVKARKILVNTVKPLVDERRYKKLDDPNTKKAMIDLLLEAKDEDGKKFEHEEIVNFLLAFLLAGHETTALVALWVIIYLHDHPQFLQRAKEEQMEIIKRRPKSQKGITLNEIRQMEYLSKVINETTRLCGIPLFLFRNATSDVEVNGYIIPKGWKVIVWNRALHMNPEIYSNPNEFLPSRWDNHKPKAGSFIPFGLGSRTCPGIDLVKIEIPILLHYFLLNYKFERINPRSPMRSLTPVPIDNCLARITKLP